MQSDDKYSIAALAIAILFSCSLAHADPGLGSLAVVFYAAIAVLIITSCTFLVVILCMIKANKLKKNGQADSRRFKRLRMITLVFLILSSPVFVTLLVNPQLGFFALLASAIFITLIVFAARIFNEKPDSDWKAP